MSYLGLFGGTFDPIHLGHLAAAEGIRHLTGLDRVLFIPNRQPPHKEGRPITPAEHRAAMVRLAIAGNPYFAFSDLELRREGPSYTIDTVKAFQGAEPGARFALLMGMDSLLEIQTWREYQNLLTLVDVLVFTRPGYPKEAGERLLASLGPELSGRIRLLDLPGVAASSSLLRKRAGQGYPLRYLVPESVRLYIEAEALYR